MGSIEGIGPSNDCTHAGLLTLDLGRSLTSEQSQRESAELGLAARSLARSYS